MRLSNLRQCAVSQVPGIMHNVELNQSEFMSDNAASISAFQFAIFQNIYNILFTARRHTFFC